jgi:hypothetical protein
VLCASIEQGKPMTGPTSKPNWQDALDSRILALQGRSGMAIALAAPLVVISIAPMGQAGVLVAALMYLGEAIVFAVRRRTGG